MSKIVAEAWVPAPIAEVFAFFSDPDNLPRLMPTQLAAKIVDMQLAAPASGSVVKSGEKSPGVGQAGAGSLITVSFKALPPLPFRSIWVAEIVEFVPCSHFRDIQQKGPMKSWSHTHQFNSEVRNGVDGTLVRDIVDYELPFAFLGSLADLLFIRSLIKLTFHSRQKALERLLLPK